MKSSTSGTNSTELFEIHANNMQKSTTQTSLCKYTITRALAARTHVGPIVVSERTHRKAVDGSSEKIGV